MLAVLSALKADKMKLFVESKKICKTVPVRETRNNTCNQFTGALNLSSELSKPRKALNY